MRSAPSTAACWSLHCRLQGRPGRPLPLTAGSTLRDTRSSVSTLGTPQPAPPRNGWGEWPCAPGGSPLPTCGHACFPRAPSPACPPCPPGRSLPPCWMAARRWPEPGEWRAPCGRCQGSTSECPGCSVGRGAGARGPGTQVLAEAGVAAAGSPCVPSWEVGSLNRLCFPLKIAKLLPWRWLPGGGAGAGPRQAWVCPAERRGAGHCSPHWCRDHPVLWGCRGGSPDTPASPQSTWVPPHGPRSREPWRAVWGVATGRALRSQVGDKVRAGAAGHVSGTGRLPGSGQPPGRFGTRGGCPSAGVLFAVEMGCPLGTRFSPGRSWDQIKHSRAYTCATYRPELGQRWVASWASSGHLGQEWPLLTRPAVGRAPRSSPSHDPALCLWPQGHPHLVRSCPSSALLLTGVHG